MNVSRASGSWNADERPRPSLSALRTLVAAANSPSLTAVAHSLGVTISAVSKQLSQLETTLGAQLLDRRARPIALTPLGRQYAEGLQGAFQSIDRVTSSLFMKQAPATVVLTTYPLFAVKWLLPRLSSFDLEHPNVELTLRSTNRVFDLKTGEADVAIRVGRASWGGCSVVKLGSEQVVAICAPMLVRGRNRGADLFRRLPLIASERAGTQWRTWLSKNHIAGVQLTGSRIFDDPLAAVEAAIAGGGVALTLRSLVSRELAEGRLIEPLPTASAVRLEHQLVVRRDAEDRPAVRRLIDWLKLQAATAP